MRSFCCLPLIVLTGVTPVLAQQASGPTPEAMLAALPAAWEGYEQVAPVFEEAPSHAGGLGQVKARYRSTTPGTLAPEYSLLISEMGESGGKMYKDYGADYLKGPVENETQRSLAVFGLPGLLTTTSQNSLMIETYLEPSLHIEAHCIRATEAECLAAAEHFDIGMLQALAAKGASK